MAQATDARSARRPIARAGRGGLFTRLLEDPNVNVRLAALEALRPLAARGDRRGDFVAAVARQESPLVALSLIDLLLESGGPPRAAISSSCSTTPNSTRWCAATARPPRKERLMNPTAQASVAALRVAVIALAERFPPRSPPSNRAQPSPGASRSPPSTDSGPWWSTT